MCPEPLISKNVVIVSGSTSGNYCIWASGTVREIISNNYCSGGYDGIKYQPVTPGFLSNNYLTGQANLAINNIKETINGDHLYIYDETLDITESYDGIYSKHIKTDGATTEADDLRGIFNHLELNDSDSTIGNLKGIQNDVTLTAGTIGDGQEDLVGLQTHLEQAAGSVGNDIQGNDIDVQLDGGSTTGDVYGNSVVVDIASAYTSVGGNIYGEYISVDADTAPSGTAYGVYLNDQSNVDYGFYQAGTNPNYFGGNVGINDNSPGEKLDVGGNINIHHNYGLKVNDTQVVGSQQAGVTKPTITASTVTVTGTDEDSTARTQINNLKTDVDSIKTALDDLIDKLSAATGHGLLA